MTRILKLFMVATFAFSMATSAGSKEPQKMISIAIHGGAGVISRDQLGPDDGAAYRTGLAEALDAGYAVLEAGPEEN